MGHPALKIDAHPDQQLLDDCQQWRHNTSEYRRLDADSSAASTLYETGIVPISDRIVATRAQTSEGRVAKALLFKAEFGAELEGTTEYLEQFAVSLCEDIIAGDAEVAPAPMSPHPDRDLLALCDRWRDAFRQWRAVSNAESDEVFLNKEVRAPSRILYDGVETLFLTIVETEARTIRGAIAKAAVLKEDNFGNWDVRDDPAERMMASLCEDLIVLGGGQRQAA